jgi:hypothetical protein
MIFYILHNIINIFFENWNESRKNCLTFIIGGTLYVLLYVFLEYMCKTTKNLFIELLHKFFLAFVVIDAFTMAILYKSYWGRSIFKEIDPHAESEWSYNENDHRYKRNRDISVEEMRKFNQKSKEFDELNSNIDDIRDNIVELDNKTNEMGEALLYHPDGDIAKECKEDFEKYT